MSVPHTLNLYAHKHPSYSYIRFYLEQLIKSLHSFLRLLMGAE